MVSSLWKNSIKKKQNKNFQQPPAWFDAVKICEMVLHPIELCAQLIYVSGWTMSLYQVYYKQAHISKDRENLVSNLVLWVSSIYPETSSTVQVRLYHTLCHSDIDWPVNLPRIQLASDLKQIGYRFARQANSIEHRYDNYLYDQRLLAAAPLLQPVGSFFWLLNRTVNCEIIKQYWN